MTGAWDPRSFSAFDFTTRSRILDKCHQNLIPISLRSLSLRGFLLNAFLTLCLVYYRSV